MLEEASIEFSLILAIVTRGHADKVVEEVKRAGAPAATIFFARGAGLKEADSFFGLTLDPAREVIMILVEDIIVDKILEVIHKAGDFDKPGTGIALSLKVTKTTGLASQLKRIHELSTD